MNDVGEGGGYWKVDNLSSFFYISSKQLTVLLKASAALTLRETRLFIRRPVYMETGEPT